MSKATSARGAILETARELTEGDRNKSYNEPSVQLGLAGLLKDVLWEYFGDHGEREIGDAEREAIDQVLTKISRVVVGREVKRDNYVDMAAYAAIAGECAEKGAFEDEVSAPEFRWFVPRDDAISERDLREAMQKAFAPGDVKAKPDDISDAGVPKDDQPGKDLVERVLAARDADLRERRLRERTAKMCYYSNPTCEICRPHAEREL